MHKKGNQFFGWEWVTSGAVRPLACLEADKVTFSSLKACRIDNQKQRELSIRKNRIFRQEIPEKLRGKGEVDGTDRCPPMFLD